MREPNMTKIAGVVSTPADIDYDKFNQCFIDWIELMGWEFCGMVAPIEEELQNEREKNMKTVYTHDEASKIIDLFESLLADHNIIIPSPEDDDKDEDNEAALYGSVYADLMDEVEYILVNIAERIKSGAGFISDEYSGEY